MAPMLGFAVAHVVDMLRRYLAALLFETARLALFAAIRAFRHRLLNRLLLRELMQISSALHRCAFFLAFGTTSRRRKRN
jgi:hypothetical protein